MSEENVNILRQGYEAFNRGDIDAVMGILDPNIEWQEPDVEGLPVVVGVGCPSEVEHGR